MRGWVLLVHQYEGWLQSCGGCKCPARSGGNASGRELASYVATTPSAEVSGLEVRSCAAGREDGSDERWLQLVRPHLNKWCCVGQ